MFDGITPTHLIILLVIVLIIFGPGRLPEIGEALGKAIRGFRDAASINQTPPMPPKPPGGGTDQPPSP